MYQVIYDFLHDNIFNDSDLVTYFNSLGTFNTDINVWLCHTFTIIALVMFLAVLCLIMKWLFKLGAGIILLR